jgi:acyl-coenzyme A thioesterase PaaI-like protein
MDHPMDVRRGSEAQDPSTTLTAEATEEHRGQRTALYDITVRDEGGDLVASCHGVVYRKKERFLDD